jgi:hypothetical protein
MRLAAAKEDLAAATGDNVMRNRVVIPAIALIAGALMLPNQEASARCGGGGEFGKANCSLSRAEMKGRIDLHRPDGEIVYIKADQIVFVMSAASTGADKRAQSKIQLLNGSFDARESVEEVMQAIKNNDSPARHGT